MFTLSFISKNKICNKALYQLLHNAPIKRFSSGRAPEAVFVGKVIEEPVIVTTEKYDVDIIGPPDAISNLRPIIRRCPLNESALQQQLRQMQIATESWNQEFWTKHNTNFMKERKEYIKSKQKEGEEIRQLTADEMSEFYKNFLDKNWHLHLKYNGEWYKRNGTLLYLSLRVHLEKMLMKIL